MIRSDTAPEGARDLATRPPRKGQLGASAREIILLLTLVGCGEDRPPVESGSVAASRLDSDGAMVRDNGSSEAEETTRSGSCIPGDVRECLVTYYDERGQKHCPLSSQFCRSNGTWGECGAPPEAEDGLD